MQEIGQLKAQLKEQEIAQLKDQLQLNAQEAIARFLFLQNAQEQGFLFTLIIGDIRLHFYEDLP